VRKRSRSKSSRCTHLSRSGSSCLSRSNSSRRSRSKSRCRSRSLSVEEAGRPRGHLRGEDTQGDNA
ncbi:hypothetical protein LSAT2_001578, partial [Lamellibrachia satsuma]